MLVDTDVLIWHLRGYPQGMRNKAELVAVQKMLQRRQAVVLPLSEAINIKCRC